MKFEKFTAVLDDSTSRYSKIPKEEYLDVGLYPIIDQGKEFIGGFTNDETLIQNSSEPRIIFGDHTRVLKYVDFPFTIGADGVKVLELQSQQILLKYVYYYLRSIKVPNAGYSRHFKFLKEVKIPLPETLTDQIKIAQILTQAEKLIAQRKESIALLDEYLKSTFLEMFGDPVRNEKGWEMLSGNDYLSKLTVGVVIKPASYYVDDGVIALRSLNIRPNRIHLDNLVYFSKPVSENELSKSILREGDVVFVRTGMTGTAAIIPKELDGCNCIDLIITRPKGGVINPQYLVFFFNSHIGKRIVSDNEVGGIQKHFNIGALRKLKIPIPTLPLQTQFAQIVEKTEALKSQYQHSLRELEQLFGSLSQRAFKGELDLSRMEVTEDAHQPSEALPVPTVPQPEKIKKERPPVAVKADTPVSIWLKNRKKGKTDKIPFNPTEGNAVLRTEFAQKNKVFHFQAFEAFLKEEGFVYGYEQVKDFLFEKLEQQELLQYYADEAWMEEQSRAEIGSEQDDFSGDGRIWLVADKKGTP